MAQRRQISGRSQASHGRDTRQNIVVQQRIDSDNRTPFHCGIALAKGLDLAGQHQTHDFRFHQRTRSRCMAPNQIGLQGRQFIVRNSRGTQTPKAGVDAVHRISLRHAVEQGLAVGSHSRLTVGIQDDMCFSER